MVIDTIIFSLKAQILVDLAKSYEQFLCSKKIDEQRAQAILVSVKTTLNSAYRPKDFKEALFQFCTDFPEFAFLREKATKVRAELLEKTARDAFESVIEEDPELWQTLSQNTNTLTEESLSSWLTVLPPVCRYQFLDHFLDSSAHV